MTANTAGSGSKGRGSKGQRPTAEERRDQVLEAAIHEFAEYGYHATKTAGIAKRAGISQPYIYALFDDKKALFLATLERVRDQIRDAFSAAYRPSDSPEQALLSMGMNYRKWLANPAATRCQLQGHAASADPEIQAFMRKGYIDMFDYIVKLTGADRPLVAQFMAVGNLLNLGAILELPEEYVRPAVTL